MQPRKCHEYTSIVVASTSLKDMTINVNTGKCLIKIAKKSETRLLLFKQSSVYYFMELFWIFLVSFLHYPLHK